MLDIQCSMNAISIEHCSLSIFYFSFYLIRSNLVNDMTSQELSNRLWHFAARVSKVVDALPDTRTGRHVAAQLIRCGTAAPPNYDEGRVAESRPDFAHKVNIALKEIV